MKLAGVFSAIFLNVFVRLEAHVVVEMIVGSVEANQFTYYSLSKSGRVVITLIPRKGDPDLYIGENGSEPDYSLENHSYQSVTCGVERIVIPRHATRPIGIGVYGHPSHEWSAYELQVKIDDSTDDDEENDLYLSEEDMKIEHADTPLRQAPLDISHIIGRMLELLLDIIECLS